MEIVFSIEVLPETPNSLKKNRWARSNENKRWDRLIQLELMRFMNEMDPNKRHLITSQFPFKKAKVTLIRHSSHVMDEDNKYGAWKSVIDAIKRNKIIEDDSPKHIELTCLWEKAKKGQGKITIKIESIPE